MLTAKLKAYSPEEVDLLIRVLASTILPITNNAGTNCNGNCDCKSCNFKHVCYDMVKLCDYLTLESQSGYPHCKK